jgi:phosphomannomutase
LFKHIELTKIGSPYVIAAFAGLSIDYDRIAGFEANGGFLLGSDITFGDTTISALPTRDAVLPFLMVFASSVTAKVLMSDLLHNNLPAFYSFRPHPELRYGAEQRNHR